MHAREYPTWSFFWSVPVADSLLPTDTAVFITPAAWSSVLLATSGFAVHEAIRLRRTSSTIS